jgi:Predicted nucleotide-binding protein containing TIR-like domain
MKIFVGSSTEGLEQVETLETELGKTFEVEQWHRDAFPPGKGYLESLQDAAQAVDFAMIVLTADDKKQERGTETYSARDNCVFEAGLFIGALKRDRVFLVTDLKEDELPSDLSGINVIDLRKGAKMIVQEIRREAKEPYFRGDPRIIPLTYTELLEREARLSKDGSVVVQSGQPIELEKNADRDVRGLFAESVRKNMKERDVYYHYFFHADRSTVENIALLCSRIATLSERGDPLDDAAISANLALMKKRLRIHFLPKQPLLDFCIHDLMSDRPKLYLRNRDHKMFYLWSKAGSALDFARDRREEVQEAWDREATFSRDGDAEYMERLKKRCLFYFQGECQATAADYLFGK